MWQCKLLSTLFNRPITCVKCFATQTSAKKTYYDILEVEPSASFNEIRTSYLKLSKLVHPDTASDHEKNTHNAFIVLTEAYSILSKPDLRKRYDQKVGVQTLHHHKSGKNFHNPFRSSTYKDPYAEYDTARRESEKWSDYYSTYGRKRARFKMEQSVDNEFWQQHWEFTRQHGGGGPQIATHEFKNVKKSFFKSETGIVVSTIAILFVLFALINQNSSYGKKDRERINEDYNRYLLTQFTPEHDLPPPKDIKYIS